MNKYFNIMKATGPDFITNVLNRKTVDACGLNIDLFNSCDYCTKICSNSSYMKHHYTQNWNDNFTKWKNIISCNPKIVFLILVIIFGSLLFLWKRYVIVRNTCKKILFKGW